MAGHEEIHIPSGQKERLEEFGLGDYHDFLDPKDAEVISEVRDRKVYCLSGNGSGPAFYLKVFKNPGGNRPLGQIAHGLVPQSLAEVEQRHLSWLAEQGFRAPKVAAWGASMKGWSEETSFLLTEPLVGMESLEDWLSKAVVRLKPRSFQKEKRLRLEAAGGLLAALHRKGFHHPYPYLRHFYVPAFEGSGSEGSIELSEIAIIDVHSARIGRDVSLWQAQRALSELFLSSLRAPLSQADRLRFLLAYAGGPPDRVLLEGVLNRIRSKLVRHPNRYRWAREMIEQLPFPSAMTKLLGS